MKEKLQKYKIKSIMAIIILLMLVFTAASVFFTTSNSSNKIYNTINLDVSYILSETSNLTLNIDEFNQKKDIVNSYSIINTSFVSLANNTFDTVMCSYEIWYTPTKEFNNSKYNTSNEKELALSGIESSNQNDSFEFDLNGITTLTKIYTGHITVKANQVLSQKWTFTLTYYYLKQSQNKILNHEYSGTIEFRSTGCESK